MKAEAMWARMRPAGTPPKLRWRRKAGHGHGLIRNIDPAVQLIASQAAKERSFVYLHSAAKRRAINAAREAGLTFTRDQLYYLS